MTKNNDLDGMSYSEAIVYFCNEAERLKREIIEELIKPLPEFIKRIIRRVTE